MKHKKTRINIDDLLNCMHDAEARTGSKGFVSNDTYDPTFWQKLGEHYQFGYNSKGYTGEVRPSTW